MKAAICICLLLILALWAPAGGWCGIVPLHSTRADVERLLGPPTRGGAYLSIYERAGEYISVQFSSGPCSPDREGGWDVPPGTVTHLSVSPKAKPAFSELEIEGKGYKRIVVPHPPGITEYANEEEGVMYVGQDGRVDIIYYVPAAKDEHLRCPSRRA